MRWLKYDLDKLRHDTITINDHNFGKNHKNETPVYFVVGVSNDVAGVWLWLYIS